MQKSFEAIAVEHYSPFIHKQARAYYNRYATCTVFGAIDYEEFYQEAALGFVQAIRHLKANTLPLPGKAIAFAKQYIRSLIFRNIILSYDGIHRLSPSAVAASTAFKVVSSIHTDDQSLAQLDESASFNDVDLAATLEALPPAQSVVAVCLINGLSRREMVRRHILPRRTIDHAVECLRVVFA